MYQCTSIIQPVYVSVYAPGGSSIAHTTFYMYKITWSISTTLHIHYLNHKIKHYSELLFTSRIFLSFTHCILKKKGYRV